jgi:hypothetical protein
MPQEVTYRRLIRETELAMCLGNAALCLDVRAVPFEVKVSHKFHKLYSPEFCNHAHRRMAERDAEEFVRPAKWACYLEQHSSEQ